MRIIFLRKEYLSLLPSMIASLFSANGFAAAIDLCQGYDIKASCHASRQSLSGITQDWSVADGQWLVFSDMTNNASGGAVFLQQGAEFSLLPENETSFYIMALCQPACNSSAHIAGSDNRYFHILFSIDVTNKLYLHYLHHHTFFLLILHKFF